MRNHAATGGGRPCHLWQACLSGRPRGLPLTYDANGNMLTGLGGKIMTYDGENRPLSVTHLGTRTRLMSTAPMASG